MILLVKVNFQICPDPSYLTSPTFATLVQADQSQGILSSPSWPPHVFLHATVKHVRANSQCSKPSSGFPAHSQPLAWDTSLRGFCPSPTSSSSPDSLLSLFQSLWPPAWPLNRHLLIGCFLCWEMFSLQSHIVGSDHPCRWRSIGHLLIAAKSSWPLFPATCIP